MPTNRRYRRRDKTGLTPDEHAWLNDLPLPPDGNGFCCFVLDRAENVRSLWEGHREEILARWISEKPGTRPSLWWVFDAPRQPQGKYPGEWIDGRLPEPRKRKGGSGIATFERYDGYCREFMLAMPAHWEEFSEENPPLYESQAAYLDRFGLVTPAERKKLKPSAFKPARWSDDVSPAISGRYVITR